MALPFAATGARPAQYASWVVTASPHLASSLSINLSAGLPLILNDNRAQLPPEEASTFLEIGLAATICLPLVKEGRLTALMAIYHKAPRRLDHLTN